MLTRDMLAAGWARLGLRPGDAVLVHSSYRSLGPVDGGPAAVVDSLEQAVAGGTLLFPTFNFDFCTTGHFDLLTTPSQMGVISETARTREYYQRTGHPIYSFAVTGAQWPDVVRWGGDRRAYRGVFDWLHRGDAWVVMVGLEWNNAYTAVHHVEEVVGCDYRYQKIFSGTVYRGGVMQREGDWSMLVRDRERGVLTQINPFGQYMEETGLAVVTQIGNAKVVAVKAKRAYAEIRAILRSGQAEGLLYEIDPAYKASRGAVWPGAADSGRGLARRGRSGVGLGADGVGRTDAEAVRNGDA